jgi:3-oxoadipate enol-lactonase
VIPHHRCDGPDGAPALVLGSSLGTDLTMWDEQLPLAAHRRLVRFDHRGHGGSDAPPGPFSIADLGRDVLELMEALGIDRAAYAGVSLGGMVGMWLAAHAPGRIDRLVLICTSAHMPPASMWRDRAATVREAGSTEPIADAVVARWLTPGFAAAHPELRARLRGMLTATDPDGYAACCGAIERMDLRPSLRRIAAPALAISGAEDLATPVEMQRAIAAAIPGARHEVVGSAAHVAVVEAPERINQLIGAHLT